MFSKGHISRYERLPWRRLVYAARQRPHQNGLHFSLAGAKFMRRRETRNVSHLPRLHVLHLQWEDTGRRQAPLVRVLNQLIHEVQPVVGLPLPPLDVVDIRSLRECLHSFRKNLIKKFIDVLIINYCIQIDIGILIIE
jgi:hypothetical protein